MPLTLTRRYDPWFSPAGSEAVYRQNLARAQAVALAPADRPQQFVVATGVRGPVTSPVPPILMPLAIETVAALGVNTISVEGFGDQSGAAALCTAAGITRYYWAEAGASGYFTWQAAHADQATWAAAEADKVANVLGMPLDQVVLFHYQDEPGWSLPWYEADLLAAPTGPTAFRAWLAAQGLAPSDVGGATWDDVLPIRYSEATTLALRRCYYWTLRFIAAAFTTCQLDQTAALRAAFSAGMATAINWNNNGRWLAPSPNVPIIGNEAGPDNALAWPDWFDFGRQFSGGALWTEDWVPNLMAGSWSKWAALMRSAALLHAGQEFGGFIVGLQLIEGTTDGAAMKALALLGQGAKYLSWYVFGPAELFPGNGWSNVPDAYRQIAAANRLIAQAEDLLYPGRPRASAVAIVFPMSAQVWDVRATFPEAWPQFLVDSIGLYQACVHAGYQVDFLSEDDVATRLGAYAVCYVTGPNLAAAAQTALAAWITAGGCAYFSPGAATFDEYNTRTTTLDAARGLTAQTMTRLASDEDAGLSGLLTISATALRGVTLAAAGPNLLVYRAHEAQVLTTATALATWAADEASALVGQTYGSGLTLSAGGWFGISYLDGLGQDLEGVLYGWEARLRATLTAVIRMAGVVRDTELDVEVVETARLDSAAGTAITLLNWTNAPISAVGVTVRHMAPVTQARLARSGAVVTVSQVDDTVTATVPLETVDVLKLYT